MKSDYSVFHSRGPIRRAAVECELDPLVESRYLCAKGSRAHALLRAVSRLPRKWPRSWPSRSGGADPLVRSRPPGRLLAPVHKGRRGRRPADQGVCPTDSFSSSVARHGACPLVSTLKRRTEPACVAMRVHAERESACATYGCKMRRYSCASPKRRSNEPTIAA
jgi:hypothetical protein